MSVVARKFWLDKLETAWTKVPIVWLSGVRRVGKTSLVRQLPRSEYLNCDLPSVVERAADPEQLLSMVQAPTLVLDEIHQLPDPSRLLKIAADTKPGLRICATGSSTLAATRKFRDSLTGRKQAVHLLPVLAEELPAFGVADLRRRLRHGGLPALLLEDEPSAETYSEWLDSFFARDVQELFRVEKRGAFLRMVELLLRQSGGLCEVTSLARACELSRPTVMSYLDALQITHVVQLLRPYHGEGRQELLRQPKVYAFDTGFVAHTRGWTDLRAEDCGLLWEHLVLESLMARAGRPEVHFWRDKSGREVDFVLPRGRGAADAIECKWSAKAFSPKALAAFRALHPKGRNFLVVPGPKQPWVQRHGELSVTVTDLAGLVAAQ
ncbi:MAG: ATP-binding protein [Polyangiaceae bacterium]|nr:ATP-binding protein [Polyangiaceae bacterium]